LGKVSARQLSGFCLFFLETLLDQVEIMNGLLNLQRNFMADVGRHTPPDHAALPEFLERYQLVFNEEDTEVLSGAMKSHSMSLPGERTVDGVVFLQKRGRRVGGIQIHAAEHQDYGLSDAVEFVEGHGKKIRTPGRGLR